MKPRIFVTSVSRELKTARQLVANTLLALGYEPVWQDIFETSGEDIRPMLRQKIDGCSAVLQIVGDAYGAEPPQADETFGRVSYTQYEALYATSKGKKVYYLIAQDDMPRDAAAEAIDVPRTDSESGLADANERRRLQSEYRTRVQSTEHIFYPVQSHPEAELSVRRLKQDLDKLRRGFRAWMIGISAALVLIAAGVGVIQQQQRSERLSQQQEREKQDREREQQQNERQAAEEARKQAQKVVDVHRTQADRFLQILLTDKDITPEAARQRAIRELPALVDLPLEEVQAIIDRKLPPSTPENPVSPLERARTALAQGKYDDVFEAADAERAEGRELAMLEGTAALSKFRESPRPEWNERAVVAFGRAVALSDKDSYDWTAAAIAMADVLHDLARYAEAEPLLVTALHIREDQRVKELSEVALVLNNLAQLLQATNRLAAAEPLVRRALAIFEQSYGAEHPNVATALNNLGLLLQATNRLAEAEPLMRRALAIFEQSYGTEHPNVARDLNNLAQLLETTNRLAEAEPMMRRALAIDEQSYGAEHPIVAIRLINLASLLKATNRLAEAEPLMRRALAIDEQSYGAEHPDVARDLNNLALLLQDTNRLAAAEPLMRRALAIDEQSYGAEHPKVAIRLNNLARLLQETNRLAEAEPMMRRALDLDEQSYGAEHPAVATDLNSLAGLLWATNHLAEAEPLVRRALAIDEHSYGPEHPAVATDINNLAQLLQATNRLAAAEPLVRRALAIDEQSYGAGHPNVARDLNNLALLFTATNRLAEAEPLMRRCVAILHQFGRKTGHEHPSMKTIDVNYREILLAMNLPEDEIGQRVKDATSIEGPLKPIVPEVDRLLGPAQPVADVLAALDQQYQVDGKPAIYFLKSDQPIAQYLDELFKPNTDSLAASGIAAYRMGAFADAIVLYDEALKNLASNPDQAQVGLQTRMNRAAALREFGEVEQARNDLIKLLPELDGDKAVPALIKGRARYHLALCESRLDNREAATLAVEESLKAYGDDAEAAALKKQSEQLFANLTENKPLPPLPKIDPAKELERARARYEARAALATLPLNESALPLLDLILGPAAPTDEVFATLDRQYREQGKPKVWFLPLNEPIAPHLDELLGPVAKIEAPEKSTNE